jgi:hypothetical protein
LCSIIKEIIFHDRAKLRKKIVAGLVVGTNILTSCNKEEEIIIPNKKPTSSSNYNDSTIPESKANVELTLTATGTGTLFGEDVTYELTINFKITDNHVTITFNGRIDFGNGTSIDIEGEISWVKGQSETTGNVTSSNKELTPSLEDLRTFFTQIAIDNGIDLN